LVLEKHFNNYCKINKSWLNAKYFLIEYFAVGLTKKVGPYFVK